MDDAPSVRMIADYDDYNGIELDKFHTPKAIRFGPVDAPMNTLGIRRLMFAVEDIDAVITHMRAHGAELIGEMEYENTYRLSGPHHLGLRYRRLVLARRRRHPLQRVRP
jgi:hypothetical protein